MFCQWNHLFFDILNHIIAGKKKSTKHPPNAPPIDKAGPALGKKIAKASGIMFVLNNTTYRFANGNSPWLLSLNIKAPQAAITDCPIHG